MEKVKALESGLGEAFEWYVPNQNLVNKKPLIEFIHRNLSSCPDEHNPRSSYL